MHGLNMNKIDKKEPKFSGKLEIKSLSEMEVLDIM